MGCLWFAFILFLLVLFLWEGYPTSPPACITAFRTALILNSSLSQGPFQSVLANTLLSAEAEATSVWTKKLYVAQVPTRLRPPVGRYHEEDSGTRQSSLSFTHLCSRLRAGFLFSVFLSHSPLPSPLHSSSTVSSLNYLQFLITHRVKMGQARSLQVWKLSSIPR